MHALVLSHFSHVQLCVTLWAVSHQTPMSVGFSRQEHWSGMPRPPLGNHLKPQTEPASRTPPTLVGGFFTTSATGEAHTPERSPIMEINHFFLHQHQNLRAQARVPWMKPQHCTNTTIRRCVRVCACARVCTHVCVSGQSLSSLLSRQEYSSAVPFQAPDLPNTGIEPVSLPYSALAGGLFSATRETQGGKRTP